MIDTLSGDGPFTLFAPNNDAFAKIPAKTLANLLKPENKDELKELLLRHVVTKSICFCTAVSDAIPKGKTVLVTAGGEKITVTNKKEIKIKSSAGTATAIETDIYVTNGIVHIVDTVFWICYVLNLTACLKVDIK